MDSTIQEIIKNIGIVVAAAAAIFTAVKAKIVKPTIDLDTLLKIIYSLQDWNFSDEDYDFFNDMIDRHEFSQDIMLKKFESMIDADGIPPYVKVAIAMIVDIFKKTKVHEVYLVNICYAIVYGARPKGAK